MNKKALSTPILFSLVLGNMIGTGIYLLPASLAQYGTISLAAWIYTSIGAVFLALTFAHLNKRFTKTGGPYAFCKAAYGPFIGFIVAYIYWASNMVSIAGIAVASIGYLGFLTPVLDANHIAYQPHLVLLIELAIVWTFAAINMIDIHAAGVTQLILTIIKVTPLILITVVGLGHVHLDNIFPLTASHGNAFQAISGAATLTFWAYIGLETATVPAENTEGAKSIYIATVFGTLVTGIIYILSSFVIMGMIPTQELVHSQFPFSQAGVMLFGTGAAVIIAICAFISGVGALNACTLIQGQIVFAAARDGLFPKIFSKLSKHDVPVAGQILSSVIITILLCLTISPKLMTQFNMIILLAGVLTLFTYLLCALAELKLIGFSHLIKKKMNFIPVLACAYSLWMILSFDLKTLLITFILIVCCMPLYFIFFRNKKVC